MSESQTDTATKPVTTGVRTKYSVPSVEKAFAVIEMFASHNRGYTLSEVSRILKLPISTTSSLLYTMQNCGYLQRGEKGQFYLSMKIVIQAVSGCAQEFDCLAEKTAFSEEDLWLAWKCEGT
jgi:hypothetical protein